VAAFARVATTNAHLAFAGDGPLRPRVRALAEQLGVSDRVHFLGLRRDVPALIRAADAVVLPSRREGLPRCALESLSLGVPVIGTRIRGLTDLVDDRSGILVPVGDVAGLAAAMQRLLDDPLYARRLGEGGRARIGTYAVDRVVALHERLYASALAARGGVLVPGSP
jgi:glycosyltransferase involved in cell wall biosynthesis